MTITPGYTFVLSNFSKVTYMYAITIRKLYSVIPTAVPKTFVWAWNKFYATSTALFSSLPSDSVLMPINNLQTIFYKLPSKSMTQV